jgi:hypothetical protein
MARDIFNLEDAMKMRDNQKRRRANERKKYLYQQLKLEGEVLCDSHIVKDDEAIILDRMLNIILRIMSKRGLNNVTRQALANHFTDCAQPGEPHIELGGPYDRDSIYINGAFKIPELAERIVWIQNRRETIDQEGEEGA